MSAALSLPAAVLCTGIKQVYAWPMSRGDYNAYRGWPCPADEDPADAGFLVEYIDGGKSNHPDHAGYVSWSPADVFHRAYHPVATGPSAGREITGHIVNPANDALRIVASDEPGDGGAHHQYEISGMSFHSNASQFDPLGHPTQVANDRVVLLFQNGPINQVGINGLTHEALLEVVADRLRSFQAGPFSCRENALALTKIEEATHWLQQRTLRRMRAGVEGTHGKASGDGQATQGVERA